MFRRKKYMPKKLIFFLIISGIMGMLVFFDRVIEPTLFTLAKVKAIHMATEILNQTVHDRLSDNQIRYQDLVQIHKDADGKIVLMQADTVKINQLSTEMTLKVQQSLRNLNENDEHIGIPLGQLLGIHILAALGPEFNVHMIPVGTVKVDIIDKFEGAGINQTRHLIWLDLSSEFQIAVPLYKEAFKVSTKVPLAESIIVGDVPPALVTLQGGVIGN